MLAACSKAPQEYIAEMSTVNENGVCTVSLRDVIQVVENDISKTKVSSSNYSIEVYTANRDKDTLMYIVNYGSGNGWKIFSADRRTPSVLAESNTGAFILDSSNGGQMAWIDRMAVDMQRVKAATDDELGFSDEEIMLNKAIWSGNTPRILDPPSLDDDEGFWEVTTTSETEVLYEKEHLTPHWDQDEPYNQYCPLQSNNSVDRAPAGCVAVAGAEVLYYLHTKYGLPSQMVSSAYCNGDVNNYSRGFSVPTTSVWASMDTTYNGSSYSNLPEAILIGFIGHLTGMNYHNTYSWTFPSQLKTNVFNEFGYSCYDGDYSESMVQTNLSNNLPVIVTASNLLIPADFNIHCFVIDGYRITRVKFTHHHHWVPGGLLPPPGGGKSGLPKSNPNGHADYTTYSYSSPSITKIKINWGWSSQWGTTPLNDGWYSLTAGWTVTNGGTYDYNYNFYTIHDFAIASN